MNGKWIPVEKGGEGVSVSYRHGFYNIYLIDCCVHVYKVLTGLLITVYKVRAGHSTHVGVGGQLCDVGSIFIWAPSLQSRCLCPLSI